MPCHGLRDEKVHAGQARGKRVPPRGYRPGRGGRAWGVLSGPPASGMAVPCRSARRIRGAGPRAGAQSLILPLILAAMSIRPAPYGSNPLLFDHASASAILWAFPGPSYLSPLSLTRSLQSLSHWKRMS